ncbi:MAG: metallophosphoesterase [Clostridiales bacterium]|nr:metallophosphoesterase [Clostridiales bacterium]
MRDDFFWFRENEIAIPGVRGEHIFMHITDNHLHAWDELSTDAEREEAEKQEANWMKGKENFARGSGEPYGEAQMISSTEAFEKDLALAAELELEALLMSGDNLDYTHPAGERYLSRMLGGYPGRFICVPGNHESESCPGVWSAGLKTFDFDGFRIAAVDDRKKTVSDADLAALEALCAEGIPLIVLCHIPVSTDLCRGAMQTLDPYFFIDSGSDDRNAAGFVSLLAGSGTVKAVICGHVHGYHRLDIAPGKPQIIGSQGMAGAVGLITVKGA